MGPDFHRLPGPLRQQPTGHQAAHRVLQRVMVTLVFRPGVLRTGRRGQGVQHRGDHRGAFGGEVPGDHPRAAERGLEPDLPVLEAGQQVVVLLVLGQGPGVDLGGQGGQVALAGPGPGRGNQDAVGGVAAAGGESVGPAADQPGHRLGQGGSFGQRREDLGVGGGAAGPAQVTAGGAFGDAGAVDQPRGGAVVRVGGVALGGGERGQDPGPGRGGDRIGLLQGLQAFGLGLGGQGGGVGGGQVAEPVQDHVERLLGAGGSGHLGPHLPGVLAGRPVRSQ